MAKSSGRSSTPSIARLARLPGVVGVFRGRRRRGGEFVDDEAVCVHVKWKRPRKHLGENELLPKAVDVLEVGTPVIDFLDHTDSLTVDGRKSTITVLGRRNNELYALTSGHGVLPRGPDGRLVKVFDAALQQPVSIDIADGQTDRYQGVLLSGKAGGGSKVDWAVVRLNRTSHAFLHHFAAGATSPLPLRASALSLGMPLYHYSSTRGRIAGRLQQVAVSATDMQLSYADTTTYDDLLLISDEHTRFSEPGESGSLIVDAEGAAVGAIVGSSRSAGVAYAYSIANLIPELGEHINAFFQ